MVSRGRGKTMLLQNVTYENEGKWICVATNSIKGTTTHNELNRAGIKYLFWQVNAMFASKTKINII